MGGDEPTWMVPAISKPCLWYREIFNRFEDQTYQSMVAITLAEAVLQESRTPILVLLNGLDANER
jgi:hypothetical protein